MQVIRPQGGDPLNRIIMDFDGANGILACGPTVPTDATAGYKPGCIFVHNDGGNNTALYVNEGTAASCDFNLVAVDVPVDFTGLTASVAELNTLDNPILATEAGAGITGGTGTVYKSSVRLVGGIYYSNIIIDLTGLQTSTTDLDIIGQGLSVAHIGQITAARNGTILFGRMTCFETPATGADDIDLYAATEGTGVFDGAVGDLAETAIITSGAAWAAADVKLFGAIPAADKYLYLTNGEAGTVGTFTAGKFLIEMFGY